MQQVVIGMMPDGQRVRIHYFVHSEAGPAQNPGKVFQTPLGPLLVGGARGYIACQRGRQSATPRVEGGRVYPVPHTDEARAVTCDRCMETKEWKETMALIAELLGDTAAQDAKNGSDPGGK